MNPKLEQREDALQPHVDEVQAALLRRIFYEDADRQLKLSKGRPFIAESVLRAGAVEFRPWNEHSMAEAALAFVVNEVYATLVRRDVSATSWLRSRLATGRGLILQRAAATDIEVEHLIRGDVAEGMMHGAPPISFLFLGEGVRAPEVQQEKSRDAKRVSADASVEVALPSRSVLRTLSPHQVGSLREIVGAVEEKQSRVEPILAEYLASLEGLEIDDIDKKKQFVEDLVELLRRLDFRVQCVCGKPATLGVNRSSKKGYFQFRHSTDQGGCTPVRARGEGSKVPPLRPIRWRGAR